MVVNIILASPVVKAGCMIRAWILTFPLSGLTPTSKFPLTFVLQVQITLSTHDCGGLSQRDITMATFMDQASLMWATYGVTDDISSEG